MYYFQILDEFCAIIEPAEPDKVRLNCSSNMSESYIMG